jgi:hypothetical protein
VRLGAGAVAAVAQGWLQSPFGRREAPLRVIGPCGSKRLMFHLQKAYAKLPAPGIAVEVKEFRGDDPS